VDFAGKEIGDELVEQLEILIEQNLVQRSYVLYMQMRCSFLLLTMRCNRTKKSTGKITVFDVFMNKKADESVTYDFSQQLTQEVAYQLNTFEERKSVHQAVALVLEESWKKRGKKMLHSAVAKILAPKKGGAAGKPEKAEDSNKEANVLAYHWCMAGNVQKQVKYLEVAGAKAMANFSHDEAAHIYSSIIDQVVGGGAPDLEAMDGSFENGRRGTWYANVGHAELELGRSDDARKSLQHALSLFGVPLPTSEIMKSTIENVLRDPDVSVEQRIANHQIDPHQSHCKELCGVFDTLRSASRRPKAPPPPP
jgi:hypothetical protein